MKDCIFCNGNADNNIIYQDNTWKVIYDAYPVSLGHVLIMPKRHCETYFDLNKSEIESLNLVIHEAKKYLDEKFHPDGYNIGFNNGVASGQTVMHFHIHMIPRYIGDIKDPQGGIRGVLPRKRKYKTE